MREPGARVNVGLLAGQIFGLTAAISGSMHAAAGLLLTGSPLLLGSW